MISAFRTAASVTAEQLAGRMLERMEGKRIRLSQASWELSEALKAIREEGRTPDNLEFLERAFNQARAVMGLD